MSKTTATNTTVSKPRALPALPMGRTIRFDVACRAGLDPEQPLTAASGPLGHKLRLALIAGALSAVGANAKWRELRNEAGEVIGRKERDVFDDIELDRDELAEWIAAHGTPAERSSPLATWAFIRHLPKERPQ